MHDYYQLAIMPMAPALVAPALFAITTVPANWLFRYRYQLLAVLLGVAAFASFVRSTSFHSWYEYGADSVLFCESVGRFAERGRKFDLVVCDPPAFGTAAGKVWSVGRDFVDLVEQSLAVLAPGGALAAISSTHKISHEEFDRLLAEGAARARTRLRIVERAWLPPDFCVAPGFPEGNYLKFAVGMMGPGIDEARHVVENVVAQVQGLMPDSLELAASVVRGDPEQPIEQLLDF